jgi:hypothetical protein
MATGQASMRWSLCQRFASALDGLRCCSVACGQIAEVQKVQMEILNDDEIPSEVSFSVNQ